MPSVSLQAPHFEQSRDGACLPACVRMVLAYQGDDRTEAEIAALLGTKPYGTPISHVIRLNEWGYVAVIASLSQPELTLHLDRNTPVIARVWTGFLSHWSQVTSHVVVVVGYNERQVLINDPGTAHTPMAVDWDEFLMAWAEFDEMSVVIHRISQNG
jgi:ABC-type bacteriocin/lantibiotic exporter with double-glycine peptidase domain